MGQRNPCLVGKIRFAMDDAVDYAIQLTIVMTVYKRARRTAILLRTLTVLGCSMPSTFSLITKAF